MATEIDLSKVKLEPKSIIMLMLGFVIVIGLMKGAEYIFNVASSKVGATGKTASAASDDF